MNFDENYKKNVIKKPYIETKAIFVYFSDFPTEKVDKGQGMCPAQFFIYMKMGIANSLKKHFEKK